MNLLVIMAMLASGAANLTIRCNVVPVAMPSAQSQPAAQDGIQFPAQQGLETTTSQTLFKGGTLVTTTVVLK